MHHSSTPLLPPKSLPLLSARPTHGPFSSRRFSSAPRCTFRARIRTAVLLRISLELISETLLQTFESLFFSRAALSSSTRCCSRPFSWCAAKNFSCKLEINSFCVVIIKQKKLLSDYYFCALSAACVRSFLVFVLR